MRNHEQEQEVLQRFLETFVQMTDVPAMLGYAAPYARSLVLMHGVEAVDYVTIGNRYFVSTAFLEELSALKGRTLNRKENSNNV